MIWLVGRPNYVRKKSFSLTKNICSLEYTVSPKPKVSDQEPESTLTISRHF
uniref:Uncharacterized protein n=1 Tax=Anguilla anguilla TaxID=7936 RepID=A0A0E9PML7_ANGAN